MSLYRTTRDYTDGRIQLRLGGVVELDDETAAQVERDSAGTLQPLSADEVAGLEAALAEASARTGVAIAPDWRPAPFVHPQSRGAVNVMTSADAWGGLR